MILTGQDVLARNKAARAWGALAPDPANAKELRFIPFVPYLGWLKAAAFIIDPLHVVEARPLTTPGERYAHELYEVTFGGELEPSLAKTIEILRAVSGAAVRRAKRRPTRTYLRGRRATLGVRGRQPFFNSPDDCFPDPTFPDPTPPEPECEPSVCDDCACAPTCDDCDKCCDVCDA